MARTKLTANNYCHKPIKGGEPVEDLIAAAKNGRQPCEQYLAGRHPDNVRCNNGISALHALVRSGSGSAAERIAMDVLIELGATADARNWRGQTPLLCAVTAGSFWAIPKLCGAGADLDAVDNSGSTVSSVLGAWLGRHPGKEEKVKELKALISYSAMDDMVAQPDPRSPRSAPRF